MLKLIGLGINIDFTLSGLNAARSSDVIYLEKYTSPVSKDIVEKVKQYVNPIVVDRQFIESPKIVEEAKNKDVALLVVGDPLSATTHYSLIDECVKKGVRYEIYHNSSIFTAVAETGLSLYKFGRTVTIAYWRDNYKPTSPIKFIEDNKSIGLHTLALLDVDENKGPMDAIEGLKTIKAMEKAIGKNIVDDVFILSRVGFDDAKITYANINDIINDEPDLGKPLFSLIIPGDMNEVEMEFSERFTYRKKF